MNALDKTELIAVLEKEASKRPLNPTGGSYLTDSARDAEYRLRLLQSHLRSPVTGGVRMSELLDLVTWLERNSHERLARALKSTL